MVVVSGRPAMAFEKWTLVQISPSPLFAETILPAVSDSQNRRKNITI
jgi:hypothetical protein